MELPGLVESPVLGDAQDGVPGSLFLHVLPACAPGGYLHDEVWGMMYPLVSLYASGSTLKPMCPCIVQTEPWNSCCQWTFARRNGTVAGIIPTRCSRNLCRIEILMWPWEAVGSEVVPTFLRGLSRRL